MAVNVPFMKVFCSIVFSCISLVSVSQNLIKGSIHGDSGEPIPYANIGIVNSSVGTISNEDGTFTLRIPERMEKEIIVFSALGYQRKEMLVGVIDKDKLLKIKLAEKVTVLDTVSVLGNRIANKTFEMGNKESKGGVFATDTVYAGAAKAILIRNAPPTQYADFSFPVFLQKARLRIFKNNATSFRFRVRFYDVDSLQGGKPGADLLQQNIVVESEIKDGWVEFDLAYLKFKVSRPFFIAFEPILEDKDRADIVSKFLEFKARNPKKVRIDSVEVDGRKVVRERVDWADFPGTAVGISPTEFAREHFICYARESSFAKWEKTRGILTATVTLSNQAVAAKQPSGKKKK